MNTTEHAQRYEVIGNHLIFARPDKRNMTFNEAVAYSEELVKHGFDGVTIREQSAECCPKTVATEPEVSGSFDCGFCKEGRHDLAKEIEIVHNEGRVSVSKIQRRLRYGYLHALAIFEAMQARGFISPVGASLIGTRGEQGSAIHASQGIAATRQPKSGTVATEDAGRVSGEEEKDDKIELAILANGGEHWHKEACRCDPSVNAFPCEYCAVYSGLMHVRSLQRENAELKKELAHKLGVAQSWFDKHNALQAQLDTAQAANETMRKWILAHGSHPRECFNGKNQCVCGRNEALAATSSTKEKP